VVGLVIFRLPPFQDAPPITMVDLKQVVDCWDKFLLTFNLC
jgi:hypothetical protein